MKLLVFVAIVVAVSADTTSSNCIDGCKCQENDQRLSIFECRQPITLSKNAFMKIDKNYVNVFSVENVIIDKIEENIFDDFPVLEHVVIENANINFIEPKAFDKSKIETLKFVNCHFHNEPQLSSVSLEELSFEDCGLEKVPLLRNLPGLTFLSLHNNKLNIMEITTFADLFDLKKLDLSKNNIHRLNGNIFVNNKKMNALILDENPLEKFTISTVNAIQQLSLKSCNLTSFNSESMEYLKHIQELTLTNNSITTLSKDAFSFMSGLKIIDLSRNQLRTLDEDIFAKNNDLEKIYLDNNNFYSLPPFRGKFYLTTFSCGNCQLKHLPTNFFENMPTLKFVKLQNNHIHDINNLFDNLMRLVHLDISNNNISAIEEDTFENNKNLGIIKLNGNPLGKLNPNVFVNNEVLHTINASSTGLTNLWTESNIVLNSVKYLIASYNQLTTLRKSDLEITPKLISIDITGNQFMESDELCETVSWLNKENRITPTSNNEHIPNLFTAIDVESPITSWEKVMGIDTCPEEQTTDDLSMDDDIGYDNDRLFGDKLEEDDDEADYDYQAASVHESENLAKLNLPIVSITVVFIITALAVLSVAVTITLFVLRRHSRFNMQTANLPRFKLLNWDTQAGMKKHCGSVYRPLSEDLSGPKSHYEFPPLPAVHTVSH